MQAEILALAHANGVALSECHVDATKGTVVYRWRVKGAKEQRLVWHAPIAEQRDVMKRWAQHKRLLGIQ